MHIGIFVSQERKQSAEALSKALNGFAVQVHANPITISQKNYFIHFDGESVVLKRGCFGAISLYYSRVIPGALIFSRSLQSIKILLGGSKMAPEAFAELLRLGYIPAPRTIWQEIRKVPANHETTIDLSKGTENTRQVLSLPPIRRDMTLADATTELKRLILLATERCLRQNGGKATPLLSGGIDSGIVTGILQKYFPDAEREAVTVAYDDKDYDETSIAAQSAQLNHIPLRVVKLTPDDVLALLPRLMKIAGEPFADSSLIACAKAYSAIPEERGILTGDGGDEIFGGYRRYRAMALRDAIPAWLAPLARWLCRLGAPLLPNAGDNRSRLATAKRFLQMGALPPAEAYASFQQICNAEIAADIAPSLPSQPPFLQAWSDVLRSTDARELLPCNALDLQCYLPEDCARKCEIAATYAHRTICSPLLDEEIAATCAQHTVCSPLLDEEVAAFALSLPQELRFDARHGKLLLRNLAMQEKLLPADALTAAKRGFGLPLARWFRSGPLADEIDRIVKELATWDRNHLLAEAPLRKILQEHQSAKRNHAPLLWLTACLYHCRKNTEV